ncbi:hypothetical protein KDW99_08795 [Marinomonas rhizomae]|uniref:hypothetical protein n=1 Tax=Marinomonas rhizomae TaxID=491948 RepID=UPI0021079939|nr:hypothetical protein [Marinomonas rhizomae]UTW01205.1 hypothetical protein KDW99_08795 [Marinomonas rhizomae]
MSTENLIRYHFDDGSEITASWSDAPRDCNYIYFFKGAYAFLKVNDQGLWELVNVEFHEWEQITNPIRITEIMKNAHPRPMGV